MTEKALQHLREVIYHRLRAWDASLDAEKELGRDVDSHSESLEHFLSGMGDPEEAWLLGESDIIGAFDLDDAFNP